MATTIMDEIDELVRTTAKARAAEYDSMKDAFNKGKAQAEAEKPYLDACPYEPATDNYCAWYNGYRSITWYLPSREIQEFHTSPARIRLIMGGRNCGKTYSVAKEVMDHCFDNPGAAVYVFRKTETSSKKTTIRTFNSVMHMMGLSKVPYLFKSKREGTEVRVPSRKAIELFNEAMRKHPELKESNARIEEYVEEHIARYCSWIYHTGLKDEQTSAEKLRGLECSCVVIIECDLCELSDVELAEGAMRWRGPDNDYWTEYLIILDSNPPDTSHWLVAFERKYKRKGPHEFQSWHLHTASNRHNQPRDFLTNLETVYEGRPNHRKRFIEGQYADAYNGDPVLHNFNPTVHAPNVCGFAKGAYLVRGWDFGARNSVVWAAYWARTFVVNGRPEVYEYWWDLYENYMEGSDTDMQCQAVHDITNAVFPFHNDRDICAGVVDACDPAGAAMTDKGSSLDVLLKNGIVGVRYNTRLRSLETSISIYNRLLSARDPDGNPCYRIDRKNCPILYRASAGKYRYPDKGEPGSKARHMVPLKGEFCDHVDHVCFAEGTMVETAAGPRDISTIRIGDAVWTSNGLRIVTKVFDNNDQHANRYEICTKDTTISVTATPNHPVKTQRGWVRISDLRLRDTIYLHKSSTGKCSTYTLENDIFPEGQSGCTGLCGSSLTETSQKAMISTTKTGTQATTTSATSKCSTERSTTGCTCGSATKLTLSGSSKTSTTPASMRRCGISLRRAAGGTQRLHGKLLKNERKKRTRANVVAKSLSRKRLNRRHTVVEPVEPVSFEDAVRMASGSQNNTSRRLNNESLSSKPASVAGRIFEPDRPELSIAKPTEVTSISTVQGKPQRVLNLEVETVNDYFANGVLVHNCDASRYAKVNLLRAARVVDPDRVPNKPFNGTRRGVDRKKSYA